MGSGMQNTEGTRPSPTWRAMVCLGALCALLVVVGPAPDPALACSCAASSDATAFEQSDAVFVGRLVGYEPPPTRAAMSSADPATWIFEVSEVYKGEVAAIQEVVSEASGASCGLEIPREGELLVFATEQGFQMPVSDGQYYAGLCGGTRSAAAGPLAVDALPSPPGPAQETTSTTIGERDTQAAAEPTRVAGGTRDDEGGGLAILIVGVAFAVAVIGVATLGWRRGRTSG